MRAIIEVYRYRLSLMMLKSGSHQGDCLAGDCQTYIGLRKVHHD